LSPFFNQTVSASKGVEALRTARQSSVLDNISKNRLKFAKNVGIILRNKTLARNDPTISIEFISQTVIRDLLYKRQCDLFSGIAHVIEPTSETESAAQIRRTALYLTLAQVPEGKVVSYGQLAELAGLGRAARWVGRTLSQLPGDTKLPWHRVLGAGGRISLPVGSPSGDEQRARLRSEGVSIQNNRVDIQRHGWRPVEHSG
jgi:methylated-DNA-protein-cysteine methyltransferase-like protein